ncbi:helix-turn-helix domain-containing protein [Lyngbya sp. CCY1209]|uniref:helix-turn-helix domain-containing protein n=1 Tax=Lyngbya sp. CCY1209 TaxID=2886103 RepID=UPI002D201861|nr:helix-turn-helix domain-containing protein [Lyngbya sp. CCY1209]MEB3884225.1 helix-turn-helix domain-containing protein [Lyngbya sp. CCY1209]
MSYTIYQNCSKCGSCLPHCSTSAIQRDNDGEFWIEPGLCTGCPDEGSQPECVTRCPTQSIVPLPAKKGRYKAIERIVPSPDIFSNGTNNPFASSMVIWEGCNLLTSASILPWTTDLNGKFYYQRPVKQGRGAMIFRLAAELESTLSASPDTATESIFDVRSACLHLIYAAHAVALERPWEQEFIITDGQIERYLGLEKRKDISKATKLSLIKTWVRQPCQLEVAIDWPQQGRVPGFTLPQERLWHLSEIQHHFQKDESGYKYLTGLTFKIRAGNWSEYFLNKRGGRRRETFYQYGTLPKFLLTAVMSIWQQHIGAARMMLWLLFKTKVGRKQSITVPTLMRVAYGAEKISRASGSREERKRLLRSFENDLEVLHHHGLKPQFDPVTYPPEIQPLWARLADLPNDAEEAIAFWIDDGSSDRRLTDSSPRGKWNGLMKARILSFDLPPEWALPLAKFEQKKQRKIAQKHRSKLKPMGLSGEQILKARKKRGISQRALAQMTGKSQSWIRDLENGRFSAKPQDQAILRRVLGLS